MIIITLYYILFGFLLGTIGYTLLDGICQILSSFFIMIKNKIDFIIVKDNEKIKNIQSSSETLTPLIGFAVPTEGDTEGEELFE